jgi:dTDP-glucose 4,6-dehydratase
VKLLVTGCAGFIGSNFIHLMLKRHPDWEITNLDKLTYAGNLENLQNIQDSASYHFINGDIADRKLVDDVIGKGFDVIVNFAAESHVDRSIMDASPFIETNIKGTQSLLDAAVKYKVPRYVQISTDEVYGSRDQGFFTEASPLDPSSPYSASKASADLLCLSYFKTHGLPVMITRCTNNYGPYQFPRSLSLWSLPMPWRIRRFPSTETVRTGRDWIYVERSLPRHRSGYPQGRTGQVYNIAGGQREA